MKNDRNNLKETISEHIVERENLILSLQTKFVTAYVHLISALQICFAVELYFLKDIFLFWYLISGAIILLPGWYIIRKRFPLKKIVKWYIIIAPLYNFYIVLQFWNLSAMSCIWLILLPFGAYVFWGKREVIWASAYAFLLIFAAFIINNSFTLDLFNHSRQMVHYNDLILITFNILVISFGTYYKSQMQALQLFSDLEEKEQIVLPITLDDKLSENIDQLFKQIDLLFSNELIFKDQNLNISVLSTKLGISNNYISRAIRAKGHTNFSSYVNNYRVEYVKKLMKTVDLKNVTLVYIYTEAGFSSQSTFNRIFKQMEGVTPSEFLQTLNPDIDKVF